MKTGAAIMVFLVGSLAAGSVWAADDGWSFEVTPYVWFVGMDGDVEVKGTKADVDVGFEDLIDKVDIGGSLLTVVQKGRWVNWLQLDYYELSDDETVDKIGGAKVEVESDTLLLTAATGIQVDGWSEGQTFDILLGVRYAGMDNELTISGVGSRDDSSDIYDAVLVIRPSFPIGKRWRFNPTLSIGTGDSDLTYELQPQFQYSFNETWAARVGYRRLYYDVEGDRGISFDGALHGFILGIGAVF
jgi:hypothetical protein